MPLRRPLAVALAALVVSAGACARSFESRLSHVSASQAAERYPIVAKASASFAKYLAAIDEPSLEARDPSASLTVRLLELPDTPRYIVFRVEGVGDSAMATWRTEHNPVRSWPISQATWSAFRDTLAVVDAWNAPWTSATAFDGITYGLEIREGDRHRALWLHNPELRDGNEGLTRLREALHGALGFKIVKGDA